MTSITTSRNSIDESISGDERRDFDGPPHPWDLLLPHRERLTRLVRSRLGDCPEVDDCVQETLLRAASFANLDTDRIGSFLTATALRLCIDQYRERERQYRLRSRLAFPDGDPTPEETICERLLGRWLLAEVRQLPHRERQVMLARASGLSTAEAAVRHNISVKAAESAFTRGRSRLREVFEAGFQLSSRQRPEDDAGQRARPRKHE